MATTTNLGLTLRTSADETIQALVTDYNANMEILDDAIGETKWYDGEWFPGEVNLDQPNALNAYRVGSMLFVNGAIVPRNSGGFKLSGRIIGIKLNPKLGDVQFPIAGSGGYGEGILVTSGDDIQIKTAFPTVDGATAFRFNLTVPVL